MNGSILMQFLSRWILVLKIIVFTGGSCGLHLSSAGQDTYERPGPEDRRSRLRWERLITPNIQINYIFIYSYKHL